MAMMHEASYKGGGHLFIVKHVDPSGEFEVGVKYHDFLFMYLGEIIEKELCAGPVVWHITEFIKDKDVSFVELFIK